MVGPEPNGEVIPSDDFGRLLGRYSSTVNLCAINILKAFDRMNHHGSFLKLMQRKIFVNLLRVI